MEVKDIKPTTEAVFRVIRTDGVEETVKFTVSFIGPQMIPDYVWRTEIDKVRLSKMVQEALVDAVLGWDLTMDGKPLLCTEENKRKFFPGILGLKLWKEKKAEGEKDEATQLDEYLGWALINFAGDQENFLKN